MSRPLTVADRLPEVGDALAYEGRKTMPYVVLETSSVPNFYTISWGGARKTIINVAGCDTYLSRADNGPLTVEATP